MLQSGSKPPNGSKEEEEKMALVVAPGTYLNGGHGKEFSL
jgi:hypothetical protein